jgi:hypothetical protein
VAYVHTSYVFIRCENIRWILIACSEELWSGQCYRIIFSYESFKEL